MKIVIANSKSWFKISSKLKKENEILYFKNPKELKFSVIEKFNPDLIFFPHWNWIVSEEIHNTFKCIVFHTSPLPFGRGGSPIQNLILFGYEYSPVCALKMTSGIDSGPVYMKKNLSLEGSLKEIFKKLNLIINELIGELINNLPEPIPQNGEGFIFKRLNEKDNLILSDESIKKVYDKIRMVDEETYPNAYIDYGDLRVEFTDAKLLNGNVSCKAIIKKNLTE